LPAEKAERPNPTTLEGHPIRVIATVAAEWCQNRLLKENIADNWYHPDLAGV
jgi:hypothetical protein